MIGTTRVFSKTRVVRWLLCASVLGLCLGAVLLGFYNQREDPTLSLKPGVSVSLQEFRTTFHADGRPQLHISGDLLRVSKTGFIGPFRLGFMHTLKGRNIAVEIVDMAEFEDDPTRRMLPPFRLNTFSPALPHNRHWGSYPGLTCNLSPCNSTETSSFF